MEWFKTHLTELNVAFVEKEKRGFDAPILAEAAEKMSLLSEQEGAQVVFQSHRLLPLYLVKAGLQFVPRSEMTPALVELAARLDGVTMTPFEAPTPIAFRTCLEGHRIPFESSLPPPYSETPMQSKD